MDLARDIVLILHFIGLASLLGGFLVQMKPKEKVINAAMFHGALTQLVTGIALVGIREMADLPVDNVKVAIKLVLLLVIGALVIVHRKRETVPTGVWGAIGGLTVAEIAVAVVM